MDKLNLGYTKYFPMQCFLTLNLKKKVQGWIHSTLQQDKRYQGPPVIIVNSKVTARCHITHTQNISEIYSTTFLTCILYRTKSVCKHGPFHCGST